MRGAAADDHNNHEQPSVSSPATISTCMRCPGRRTLPLLRSAAGSSRSPIRLAGPIAAAEHPSPHRIRCELSAQAVGHRALLCNEEAGDASTSPQRPTHGRAPSTGASSTGTGVAAEASSATVWLAATLCLLLTLCALWIGSSITVVLACLATVDVGTSGQPRIVAVIQSWEVEAAYAGLWYCFLHLVRLHTIQLMTPCATASESHCLVSLKGRLIDLGVASPGGAADHCLRHPSVGERRPVGTLVVGEMGLQCALVGLGWLEICHLATTAARLLAAHSRQRRPAHEDVALSAAQHGSGASIFPSDVQRVDEKEAAVSSTRKRTTTSTSTQRCPRLRR